MTLRWGKHAVGFCEAHLLPFWDRLPYMPPELAPPLTSTLVVVVVVVGVVLSDDKAGRRCGGRATAISGVCVLK